MNEIAPSLREHCDGWERTITALRGRRWVAEYMGSAAPVQVERELPTGELFYFRARHADASLAVGGDDPADIPLWRMEAPCEDASYLPGHRGLEVILRLWEVYGTFTSQA